MKSVFNKKSQSSLKKEPEWQIFLDMDGVISDFDRHCTETGTRRADGSPDYNRMNTREWYSGMCVFDGAREFYDALLSRTRVRFLTAPIKFAECFGGKAEWILKFVPERGRLILGDLMIVASKDKQLIAAPKRILIDDSEANVREWNAAGGIGILHKGDYAQTLRRVDEILKGSAPKNILKPSFVRKKKDAK